MCHRRSWLICTIMLSFVLALGCAEPTAKKQSNSSSSTDTSGNASKMENGKQPLTFSDFMGKNAYQQVSIGLKYDGNNAEQAVLDALAEFTWLDREHLKVTFNENEKKYYLSFRLQEVAGPGAGGPMRRPNIPSDPEIVIMNKLKAAGFTVEGMISRREVEQ